MEQEKGLKNLKRYKCISILPVFSAIFILLLLMSFIVLPPTFPRPFNHTTPEGYCGVSAVEARSLGCQFEPISFSWLAPSCIDEDLTRLFLEEEESHWYFDMGKQREANRNAVLAGDYELLYVDSMYHLQHCLYMWRKLNRAILNGSVIDGYIGSYVHTQHCGHMLLSHQIEDGNVSLSAMTLITAKYPACSRTKDGLRAGWYYAVNGSRFDGLSELRDYLRDYLNESDGEFRLPNTESS